MLNVDIDGHHGFLIKTNKSQIFSKNIPAKLIDSGFKKNTILKHFYYRVLYFIFISPRLLPILPSFLDGCLCKLSCMFIFMITTCTVI